jgi:ribonuclease P protein component
MPYYTFHRKERLKSRKLIARLFHEGKTVVAFPLRMSWLPNESPSGVAPCSVGFTVPKRIFPKAVHRNRIKRRMREAYRLNKHILIKMLENSPDNYALMFIYIGRKEPDFWQIEKSMKQVFRKFVRKENLDPK